MLNRPSNDTIRDAARSARQIQLGLRKMQALLSMHSHILVLEDALNVLHNTKLDRDTGTDTNQGELGAFVEGRNAPLLENVTDALDNPRVTARWGGLHAHLDNIERSDI